METVLFIHAGAEMYGADKVMLDLITNLNKKKYRPIVILPSDGILKEKLEEQSILVYTLKSPILRRKYFNPIGIIYLILLFIISFIKINNIIKQEKVKIIHSNTSAVTIGCYLAKWNHLPHLWVIHEIIVSPKFVYKYTSKVISKYATKVVVVSNAVKIHLEKTGYFVNKEIQVIHNGLDFDKYNSHVAYNYLIEELSIESNSIVIGMIGRVNAWKGQTDFIRAAKIIADKFDRVYFLIVGDNYVGEEKYYLDMIQLINSLNMDAHMRLLKFREDTPALYNLMDIFVLPSSNPDPLPTVVLEAMACGKPIVGYKHGGIMEMVIEDFNGLLAEPKNYNELAEKCEILINDKKKLINFGQNSVSRVRKNFSMQNYVSQYEDVYTMWSVKDE